MFTYLKSSAHSNIKSPFIVFRKQDFSKKPFFTTFRMILYAINPLTTNKSTIISKMAYLNGLYSN